MASTGTTRIQGVDPAAAIKAPCTAATTANITLSGAQTIDGIAVAETTPPTRVLVRAQTDGTENGIYDVKSTAWTRSEDFDGSRDVVQGTLIHVNSGTLYSAATFSVSTTGTITIGSTSLTFVTTNATNSITITGDSSTDTYAKVRGLSSGTLSDGDVIPVTGAGIEGGFKVKTGANTDDGGTILQFNDDSNRYAERMVVGGIYYSTWFANGDGTIETTELNNGLTAATGKEFIFVQGSSDFVIDATLEVPAETTVKWELGAVIRPHSTMSDSDWMINCGKGCVLDHPQLFDSVEERRTINGIRAIVGSPVAQHTRIISPRCTDLGWAIYLRGHNNRIEDCVLWSNSIAIYVGSQPGESETGGTSGSVTINGGRIHDNNYGVWQSVDGIDCYIKDGVIFEYNRRHLHTKGYTSIEGCYMKDAANVDIEGSGEIYCSGTDMASLGSGNSRLDDLPFTWDNSSTGSDFSTGVSVDHAHFVNTKFYTGQENLSPISRWGLFDNGTITMTNCSVEMNASVTTGAQHIATAKTSLSAGVSITPNGSRYPNYVFNGLFIDADKLNTSYINNPGATNFAVDTTRRNCWGGACLQVYRSGIRLRYKVPNFDSARKYLLIVLKGDVLAGTGQETGVDMTNSTITNVTAANLTTNTTTSGNAVCSAGTKYSDREVMGCTSFIVTLDDAEGIIALTNTLTATTGNEEVYGIILTDIEDEDVDSLNHMPFGWFYEANKPLPYGAVAIADGDATPSVKGETLLITANTGATTITDFDDGEVGQVIRVIIGDANTDIDFTGTNLLGNAGADWTSATTNDHMTCVYDGTNWYCDVSDNTV